MREAYDMIWEDESKVPCFCYQQYDFNFTQYFKINFDNFHQQVKQGEIDAQNKELRLNYENQLETIRLERLSQDADPLDHFESATQPSDEADEI